VGLEEVLIVEAISPGATSIEHFDQGATQRPDIALASRPSLFEDFGSHPLNAADDLRVQRAEGGHRLRAAVAALLEVARAAEVAEFDHGSLVGQYVRALQVEMLNLPFVQVG